MALRLTGCNSWLDAGHVAITHSVRPAAYVRYVIAVDTLHENAWQNISTNPKPQAQGISLRKQFLLSAGEAQRSPSTPQQREEGATIMTGLLGFTVGFKV